MTMQITISKRDLLSVEVALMGIQNGAVKALNRAINKSLTGVRTDKTNEAAKVLNMKKTDIRNAIKIGRATWSKLTGVVSRTGRPVPLAKFKQTRQTKKGVSVLVKTGGQRTILKHAFIATMRSGHVGVYWREDREFVATGAPAKLPARAYGALPEGYRLPIKELYGPRVEDILAEAGVMARIIELANERMKKNLEYETNYMLTQAARS